MSSPTSRTIGTLKAPSLPARQAFVARNGDKRLGRDFSGFDGSGLDPVRFDFRLEGILRYANVTGL